MVNDIILGDSFKRGKNIHVECKGTHHFGEIPNSHLRDSVKGNSLLKSLAEIQGAEKSALGIGRE